MGSDVSDYNNDGKVDIVVVDMLPEDNKRWKLRVAEIPMMNFKMGSKMDMSTNIFEIRCS